MLLIMVFIMGFILFVFILGVVKVLMEFKWLINVECLFYGV